MRECGNPPTVLMALVLLDHRSARAVVAISPGFRNPQMQGSVSSSPSGSGLERRIAAVLDNIELTHQVPSYTFTMDEYEQCLTVIVECVGENIAGGRSRQPHLGTLAPPIRS